jgi:hypothetical protein
MTECRHLTDPAQSCATCNPAARLAPSPELWGPWFAATYNGDCEGCGDGILPGDSIRPDGEGGYLCGECGELSA